MRKTAFSVTLAAALCSFASLPSAAADAVTAATLKPQVSSVQVDSISGATEKREATSGAFSLMKTEEGRALLIDMARSFIWTGDSVFNGKTVKGGRQMFSISTSYNNIPESITAELTPEYFPETGSFLFYGTTAKDSGKILR